MSIDTLEQELLSYRHPISSVSSSDIENLGWELDKVRNGEYFTNYYKLGNKSLAFLRVQTDSINAMSWLLQIDGKNKQLVHTLGELERITNGE